MCMWDSTLSSIPHPLFKRFFEQIPKPFPANRKAVFQPTKEGFRLLIETGLRELSAVFFPEDQDISIILLRKSSRRSQMA